MGTNVPARITHLCGVAPRQTPVHTSYIARGQGRCFPVSGPRIGPLAEKASPACHELRDAAGRPVTGSRI